jgi:hypothetical protein
MRNKKWFYPKQRRQQTFQTHVHRPSTFLVVVLVHVSQQIHAEAWLQLLSKANAYIKHGQDLNVVRRLSIQNGLKKQ